MKKWPEPRLLKVTKKGEIIFTPKQWKFLAEATCTTDLTLSEQRSVITKFIHKAIKAGLEKSKS